MKVDWNQLNAKLKAAEFDLTQIIDGKVITRPAPNAIHQQVSGNLVFHLHSFVNETKAGEVYSAPLDVILEEGINRVQPDILFIRQDRRHIIKDFVEGPPDLVIEIISPASLDLDAIEKKEIYQQFGVPEYWIVAPRLNVIMVFSLEAGTYKLDNHAAGSGIVTSRVLPGFSVDLESVFAG